MDKQEILRVAMKEHSCLSIDPYTVYENMQKAAVQSMDVYAEQEATGFNIWVSWNFKRITGETDLWEMSTGVRDEKTYKSEQLYELYIQSKK